MDGCGATGAARPSDRGGAQQGRSQARKPAALGGRAAWAALDDGEVVGSVSLIAPAARPGVLEHGLTAVRRTHRGRGIALALKRQAVAWAAAQGYHELTRWTQEGNPAMRAVNVRVGFVEQPPWILFRAPLP